ncbi:M9 family metallopeptidase N-terminal domain-containing protein, partial [Streptomyces sp. NPDC001193]
RARRTRCRAPARGTAPGGLAADGRVPGAAPSAAPAVRVGERAEKSRERAATAQAAPTAQSVAAGVPCTLDGITGLGPEQFADFLADPAVTADGCMRGLIWTWDARLAPVMDDAHVQAVARRISGLAAAHDGRGTSHLEEMFTYLHAAVYHDFSRGEIDLTDAATADAMSRAVTDFGNAARTFDVTASNARTLREALYATGPGMRQTQLGLIKKVLATLDASHPATSSDANWGGAALAALTVNYLGVYPGNQDAAFQAAAKADPAYRAAFKAFSGYTHLKGTTNAWVVRDALGEYGRFGQIDGLQGQISADLGGLLEPVKAAFGAGSEPWAKIVSWLNTYNACKQYGVCKEDIEKMLFPNTYTYD